MTRKSMREKEITKVISFIRSTTVEIQKSLDKIKTAEGLVEDDKTKLFKIKVPEFEIIMWAKNENEAFNIARKNTEMELSSVSSRLGVNRIKKVKSWEDIDDDTWNSFSIPWGDSPDANHEELKDYLGLKPGD